MGIGEKGIYYWEPHIYAPFDRDMFLEYARWSDYEHRDDVIIMSGYFNFALQQGDHISDHTFIYDGFDWSKRTTHIAYSDSSFDAAMSYLRVAFPGPCRFERK